MAAPSAPKSLRQVPVASGDGNAEELGAPLVNEGAKIRLQPPPEYGTRDKASPQGSAQVGTADSSCLGDLGNGQSEEPHQEPHTVEVPPIPVRWTGLGLVTPCNGVLGGRRG